MVDEQRRDRVRGVLLGTALGDALGLPMEGLGPRTIARRFGRVERFHLLGQRGFVSDDTEQTALVAQSLLRGGGDAARTVTAFRRSLLGWFLRLPWGLGLATLRACVRMLLGLRVTGVRSAGNGAAMRSSVVGAWAPLDAQRRRDVAERLARVTHLDDRAVQGAVLVAEVTAALLRGESAPQAVAEATTQVTDQELHAALEHASALATSAAPTSSAAQELGTTGYVVHTLGFVVFCFLRHGSAPLTAFQECIGAGGDTDSTGAILGAWLGALHGEKGLPEELLTRLHDGVFGPTHLRALADALCGAPGPVPGFAWPLALLRNLALYPVVLAHGFRRLVPY